MEQMKIGILAFMFVVLAFTVLVTLCYKGDTGGGRGDGSSHRKRNNKRIAASLGGKTYHDVKCGPATSTTNGLTTDNGTSAPAAATMAFTVMSSDGGGGAGAG